MTSGRFQQPFPQRHGKAMENSGRRLARKGRMNKLRPPQKRQPPCRELFSSGRWSCGTRAGQNIFSKKYPMAEKCHYGYFGGFSRTPRLAAFEKVFCRGPALRQSWAPINQRRTAPVPPAAFFVVGCARSKRKSRSLPQLSHT